MNKIKITPINNGPLKIDNLTQEVLSDVLFYDEETILLEKNAFICRCGKSNNQPYCDGNHKKEGFSSIKEIESDTIQTYKSDEITITFNRSICSGSANCVHNFSSIYTSATENWIDPNKGTVEEIISSVKGCPSGALSYEINSEKTYENYNDEKIYIIKNGPINIHGNIDLKVESWSEFANKSKFTLCRCGASKNKPFCDYTHASLDKKDYTF